MSANLVKVTHTAVLPPTWSIKRPKSIAQKVYDFVLAPLRMVVFPDSFSESLHLTSLRAERFSAVLPHLRGRVLDIGAGDNVLVNLYKQQAGSVVEPNSCADSVGVDVFDWGGGVTVIETAEKLPFADSSFDTVTFIACINHIPERESALAEVRRVLKPGGRVILTMIGRVLGEVGHKLWWYSEDKHRDVDEEELMGMDLTDMVKLISNAGFVDLEIQSFVYGLNKLYIAHRQ